MDRLPLDITLRLPPVEGPSRPPALVEAPGSFQDHLDRAGSAPPAAREERPRDEARREAAPPGDSRPTTTQPAEPRDETPEETEADGESGAEVTAHPLAESAPAVKPDAQSKPAKPAPGRHGQAKRDEAKQQIVPSDERISAEDEAAGKEKTSVPESQAGVQVQPSLPGTKKTATPPAEPINSNAAPAAVAPPVAATEVAQAIVADVLPATEEQPAKPEANPPTTPVKPRQAATPRGKMPASGAEPAPAESTTAKADEAAIEATGEGDASSDGERDEREREVRPKLPEPAIASTTAAMATPGTVEPELAPVEAMAEVANREAEKPAAAQSDRQAPVDATSKATNDQGSGAASQRPAPPALSEMRSTRTTPHDTLPHVDRTRFIQRVTKAFQTAGPDGGTVRLRLSPPELGSLKIEISVRGGALTAHVEAETPAARAVLIESLPVLRERLAEQQMKIDRFDVDLMQNSPGGLSGGQQFDNQQERAARANRIRPANTAAEAVGTTTTSKPTTDSGRLNVII